MGRQTHLHNSAVAYRVWRQGYREFAVGHPIRPYWWRQVGPTATRDTTRPPVDRVLYYFVAAVDRFGRESVD